VEIAISRQLVQHSPSPVLGFDPSMGEGGRRPDEGSFLVPIFQRRQYRITHRVPARCSTRPNTHKTAGGSNCQWMKVQWQVTRKKAKVFKPGALSRLIIDSLRRAGTPQSTKEVVAAVTAAIGQEQASELLMASTVRGCLGYLTRRGSVMQIGKGIGTTWRLTQTAPQPEQRN
jgi:hypothetical protein